MFRRTPEDHDLPKSLRLFIGHSQYGQSAEMRPQNSGAVIEPLKGYDEHQNAFGHQPTVCVFEEEPLHTIVGDLPDLGIVRRIQVEEREGLGFGDRIEGIALSRFDTL